MDMKHEEYFVKEYPNIYVKLRTGEPFTVEERESGMVFGFECGDGWFMLLDELSAAIKCHVDNYNRNKPDDEEPLQVKAQQVKEKFGGLRFYVGGADNYVHGLIDMAERMSYKICEICGSTEDVQTCDGRWISYWCKTCREKKNK